MIFSSTLVTLVLLLNKKSCWETIHLHPTHHRQSIRRSSALVPAVWAQARLGCRSRRATRRSPNRLPGSSTMASVAGKGEFFFSPRLKSIDIFVWLETWNRCCSWKVDSYKEWILVTFGGIDDWNILKPCWRLVETSIWWHWSGNFMEVCCIVEWIGP